VMKLSLKLKLKLS